MAYNRFYNISQDRNELRFRLVNLKTGNTQLTKHDLAVRDTPDITGAPDIYKTKWKRRAGMHEIGHAIVQDALGDTDMVTINSYNPKGHHLQPASYNECVSRNLPRHILYNYYEGRYYTNPRFRAKSAQYFNREFYHPSQKTRNEIALLCLGGIVAQNRCAHPTNTSDLNQLLTHAGSDIPRALELTVLSSFGKSLRKRLRMLDIGKKGTFFPPDNTSPLGKTIKMTVPMPPRHFMPDSDHTERLATQLKRLLPYVQKAGEMVNRVTNRQMNKLYADLARSHGEIEMPWNIDKWMSDAVPVETRIINNQDLMAFTQQPIDTLINRPALPFLKRT